MWASSVPVRCSCPKARGVRREDRKNIAMIRVVGVRREPLRRMLDDKRYGIAEIKREGFKGHREFGSPAKWIEWFCSTHRGCTPRHNDHQNRVRLSR
jgi:hypothetical protein